MSENKNKAPKDAESTDGWSFIPYFVERMFGTVEGFVERLSDIVTDRAQSLVYRAVYRLFGFLLLVVGIFFFLSGTAELINGIMKFPGVGQMAVGTFILLVTGSVMLLGRRRA